MSDKDVIFAVAASVTVITIVSFWAYQDFLAYKDMFHRTQMRIKELELELERIKRERRMRGEDK